MNPNVCATINGVVAAMSVLAAMTPAMFPSYIPPGAVTAVIQTAGFAVALATGINSALHLQSPAIPGALGK